MAPVPGQMIAREALALEGAWSVRTDAIVAHIPSLTLIFVCRAQRSVRGLAGGGFRLLFSLCCPFVWSTRAEPRGPSPRSHTQTMHDVGAKCSQDSSAMFDAKELMSSQPSSTLTRREVSSRLILLRAPASQMVLCKPGHLSQPTIPLLPSPDALSSAPASPSLGVHEALLDALSPNAASLGTQAHLHFP